jgi:predicted mannosyl-3-phosphoglycerate phosphatase (HAD superfamily)
VLDQSEEKSHSLVAAATGLGLTSTQGGRFWHISGANDQAVAVTALRNSFRQAHGRVRTVGLRDSFNDASFLALVDVPVVVRSP